MLTRSLLWQTSQAYELQNFRYVGDGYFYSEFVEPTAPLAARLVGQFLEGSLLDFQLADLFQQCKAGDVRVHYEAVRPAVISVVALMQENVCVCLCVGGCQCRSHSFPLL